MTGSTAIHRALKERRSIRAFRPDPVSEDQITAILEAALDAPSWGNVQPYRVAVASGALANELREEYTTLFHSSRQFMKASLLGKLLQFLKGMRRPDGDHNTIMTYPDELGARYRETGFGLYGTLGIERYDRAARERQMARNFSFFDAPSVLFVFAEDSLGPYGPLDTGAFIQSVSLAAQEAGLGTCIQAALATWASPVRKRFDVPGNYKLVCGISLGYPADDKVNSFAPKRRGLDSLLLARKP